MPSLRTRIINSLKDGPWSAWELSVTLGIHNKYLVWLELRKLLRDGIVYPTDSRTIDPVTKGSCLQYSLYQRSNI